MQKKIISLRVNNNKQKFSFDFDVIKYFKSLISIFRPSQEKPSENLSQNQSKSGEIIETYPKLNISEIKLADGSIVYKKNNSQLKIVSSKDLINQITTNKVFSSDKPNRVFHASGSQSLFGVSKSGLRPLDKQVRFSGELQFGALGYNQQAISAINIQYRDFEDIAKYLLMNTNPWNPVIGQKRLSELKKILDLKKNQASADSPLMEVLKNNLLYEKMRIESWVSLAELEKDLIEKPFPVLFEWKNPTSYFVYEKVQSDISGERPMKATPISELIIYVPTDKISLTKEILGAEAEVRSLSSL